MDADTYPDKNVTELITENIVPLRILFGAVPLSRDFKVKWTPTLILLDITGKEHYRIVGFTTAEEIIPALLLGIAKTYFELDQLDQANRNLDRVISEHPKSAQAPEATYFRGVYGYKKTHDRNHLRQAYEKLRDGYPQTERSKWTLPLAKSAIRLLVSYLR
ncbi:MAG: tetratricopeptide repeat protein [Syntrophales bacterium]|jgi:tetratricopeptide (TPR) repeat protein